MKMRRLKSYTDRFLVNRAHTMRALHTYAILKYAKGFNPPTKKLQTQIFKLDLLHFETCDEE